MPSSQVRADAALDRVWARQPVLVQLRRATRRWLALTAAMVLVAAFSAYVLPQSPPTDQPPSGNGVVCGTSSLISPFNYTGASGSYTSGTAGLPTFGSAGTNFPNATAGDVLPPGTQSYLSFQLAANTVYYLEPGVYTGQIQANSGDAFVGGYSGGTFAVLTGAYTTTWHYSIDSNSSNGNQPNVTVEYLTVEQFEPVEDQSAMNPSANTGWTIIHDTITQNVPGAGLQGAAAETISNDCLTANGQYAINATDTLGFGADTLTGGPYGLTISNDEISFNDTCDLVGLITNAAAGLSNWNPVPPAYQNSHCTDQGSLVNDGNWGGFKLWRTNGVMVTNNWIHDNIGTGGWADTNNANTTWSGNYIVNNDWPGITEEISYNFGISGNTLIGNDWMGGLGNPGFPQPGIYVSESGSDSIFGGIPACSEPACAGFPSYTNRSLITGNTVTNNGGGIFLWENAGRYCSSGIDSVCTLVSNGAFTISNCTTNFKSTSTVNTSTYIGNLTGSPSRDWWDGCQWETANILISGNTIGNNQGSIPICGTANWSSCGANGIFSNYVNPTTNVSAWAVGSAITFYRNNTWAGNNYLGPYNFFAWQQGNSVTSQQWMGPLTSGDLCTSGSETSSARCAGPFQQDVNSSTGPWPLINPVPGRPGGQPPAVIPARIGRH